MKICIYPSTCLATYCLLFYSLPETNISRPPEIGKGLRGHLPRRSAWWGAGPRSPPQLPLLSRPRSLHSSTLDFVLERATLSPTSGPLDLFPLLGSPCPQIFPRLAAAQQLGFTISVISTKSPLRPLSLVSALPHSSFLPHYPILVKISVLVYAL